jgi:hypothetical protein
VVVLAGAPDAADADADDNVKSNVDPDSSSKQQ